VLPSNDRIFAATNFQLVTVRIFKKAGVIAAAVGATEFRAFQILSAKLADKPCQPINFCTALSPKRDSRAVGLMPPILREAEKRFRLVAASSIEYSPSAARSIARKTERRQQLGVKPVCALDIADAQVDVVEVSRLFHFLTGFHGARRTTSFNPSP
jgi:hypothetical protein